MSRANLKRKKHKGRRKIGSRKRRNRRRIRLKLKIRRGKWYDWKRINLSSNYYNRFCNVIFNLLKVKGKNAEGI